MLILTRKVGESIKIGNDITVSIVEVRGHQVRVGIVAPRTVIVHREEIYQLIQEENRNAAMRSPQDMTPIRSLWQQPPSSL